MEGCGTFRRCGLAGRSVSLRGGLRICSLFPLVCNCLCYQTAVHHWAAGYTPAVKFSSPRQSGTVNQRNRFSPNLFLSGYFITETETKTELLQNQAKTYHIPWHRVNLAAAIAGNGKETRKNWLKANQTQPGKIPKTAASGLGNPTSPAPLLLSHTLFRGLALLHTYRFPWLIS